MIKRVDLSPLPAVHLHQSHIHWSFQLRASLLALQAAQDQSVEFQEYGGAACASAELFPVQKAVEEARGRLVQVEEEMRKRAKADSQAGSEAGPRRGSYSSVDGLSL